MGGDLGGVNKPDGFVYVDDYHDHYYCSVFFLARLQHLTTCYNMPQPNIMFLRMRHVCIARQPGFQKHFIVIDP